MINHTLNSEDLVVITSLSGHTPVIQNTAKLLNLNQVPLCLITCFGKHLLSNHANFQLYYEISKMLSSVVDTGKNMVALNIILSILSHKYKEFVLFDE